MLKAQESQEKMGKNMQKKKRCIQISRVKIQKRRVSRLLTTLMILCTFLMMPEMTLQLMDRKEDLVTLIFNMSQKQQSLFQWRAKRQRFQRTVIPLREKSEIQLDDEVQDQFGKGSDQNVTRTRAEKTLGNSTFLALKVTEGINMSQLLTLAPQMIATTSTPLQTVVRTKLGRAVSLPCRCGRFNVGGNNPPMWKNSRGEDVLLTGPEVDMVPRDQRKYLLFNDWRWLKVRDDCSLLVRNVTWEDQGEYTCTYFEPELKFVPFQNVWREGYITRKVVVVIEDLSSSGIFRVATRVTTATTPRVNITLRKLTTLAPETTKNVNTSIQAVTLATILKGMNATTGKATISSFVTGGNITSEVGLRATYANKTVTTSLSPRKVVNITQTPGMTLLNFKERVNITQKPMLKIELSVNSSKEILEPRKQKEEQHDADSSVTAQRTILGHQRT
ncbi:uncharacterized protein LOC118817010 isoform X2 [Colossoma macropomum]|uniref:uncharacterized protein LOC118817010 isoform X2 n=1 Tax=Colossoma macropomum TaxID=42526 RepID=UPI00186544F9|nr:uncharacterized protein LOC118817010 isoform X2 [Colossoma macropomum]